MVDNLPKRKFKEELQSMDPYKFEEWVANVWEIFGHQTTVRNGSRDRGIDIVAVSQNDVRKLIQVKRYKQSNKVGSDDVRKYATLYVQDQDSDNVIIVTSSSFTTPAEQLASDLNVTAIDGDDLWGLRNKIRQASESSSESAQDKSTNGQPRPADEVKVETDAIPSDKGKIRRDLKTKTVSAGEELCSNGYIIHITDVRPSPRSGPLQVTGDTRIRFIYK